MCSPLTLHSTCVLTFPRSDPGDEFMVFAYILYEEDWRVIEVFPLLFTLERGECLARSLRFRSLNRELCSASDVAQEVAGWTSYAECTSSQRGIHQGLGTTYRSLNLHRISDLGLVYMCRLEIPGRCDVC